MPGAREKNYREASASSMFVYALYKGIKNGWLDRAKYGPVAAAATGESSISSSLSTPRVASTSRASARPLGWAAIPIGTDLYAYYTGIDVVTNEPKGLGAFLLASAERE